MKYQKLKKGKIMKKTKKRITKQEIEAAKTPHERAIDKLIPIARKIANKKAPDFMSEDWTREYNRAMDRLTFENGLRVVSRSRLIDIGAIKISTCKECGKEITKTISIEV